MSPAKPADPIEMPFGLWTPVMGIGVTLGHVPPTRLPIFYFFKVHFRAAQRLTAAFVRLPLQIYLYSASAAAVVQLQLHNLVTVSFRCNYI